ncbi:hypothetical protein DPMN_017554 [Dreissena polymorpha]|uniref:Uncharacterized protein n=1 Tax=Dreissena polymorpha TaxID=45954 RepID=A0A9D4NBL1_DREPO|nr:hypothetical protein DPMN_017554 [Dreissena polymorpha]
MIIGQTLITAPPTGGHVFQRIGTTFELNQDIIKTNIFTKIELGRDFIGTKLLTKFHEDGTRNQMLTDGHTTDKDRLGRNSLSPKNTRCNKERLARAHTRQLGDRTCFFKFAHTRQLGDRTYIIGTNLLTTFHEDWKIIVSSRVFTRKNDPPPGGHVFQPTGIIFYVIQDIIGMNLLTKFHEDRAVNVASRVLTRFNYSHIRKNAPPLESHFFKQTIIFILIQDIIETNLLAKFHEDWKLNAASREKCPAPGGHVFKATKTIFHDRKINVTSRVLTRLWWPYIIGMNLLTEFHEDRTINVASREKCAALGSHVFQANLTIFDLIQDIIKTNLLTKFHEDWTINANVDVAQRTTQDGRRTKGDHNSSP